VPWRRAGRSCKSGRPEAIVLVPLAGSDWHSHEAVYPSHAFFLLPSLGNIASFSRQHMFPHPGVYHFVGRLSVGGVASRAAARVRVIG
jgi:hypothetical protein